MPKARNCIYCGVPRWTGCKHSPRPRTQGFSSKKEVLPIEKCKEAHLEEVCDSEYPYCNNHGAMLAVEKECEIWRCIACGLGVKWKRR